MEGWDIRPEKQASSRAAFARENLSGNYKVMRRNGSVVPFDSSKIRTAMSKAFIATEEGPGYMNSSAHREILDMRVDEVMQALLRARPHMGTFNIEEVQDKVELVLMRAGHQQVARNYVLYRAKRDEARQKSVRSIAPREYHLTRADGSRVMLDIDRLHRKVDLACQGLDDVDPERILHRVFKEIYDGVTQEELHKALILASRMLIEFEPNYSYASARLLLDKLREEVLGYELFRGYMDEEYPQHFREMLDTGVSAGLINPELKLVFDLKRLGCALRSARDLNFGYLGLQTLYDRYFLHVGERRIEMPQTFFMRVAMGLALREDNPTMRAIEFYNLLSRFEFMCSTPTLFNSGTTHAQLSSCYLSTVGDDLDGIYTVVKENALLAKFAGGLGNDWTPVRAMGSHIRGTNGKSQGVIPFLKVVNDTAVAVNQCFAPETEVYTADGVRRISDIAPGDLVLGHSGCYREVLERFAYEQKDAMVAIEAMHSIDSLMVTAGHPLMALKTAQVRGTTDAETMRLRIEDGGCSPEWTEAGELSAGDYVAQTMPQETVGAGGLHVNDARMMGIAAVGVRREADGSFQFDLSAAAPETVSFAKGYLRSHGLAFAEPAGSVISFALPARRASAGSGAVAVAGSAVPEPVERMFSGGRRIPRAYSHLPLTLALPLVEGMVSAAQGGDGKAALARGLAEDARYQLLRLGVPCAGRRVSPMAVELDVSVDDIRMRMASVSGDGWFRTGRRLYSRIERAAPIKPLMEVHDLRVEGDESYMTGSALAHNGGKRKGAVCCYLETWHLDIEEFLELRKNSGDERRRMHDMNTANWIPDLFMKRVETDGFWTLFSPCDVPDLHDKFGQEFEKTYLEYEQMADEGRLHHKRINAVDLWRKMLTMLYETGHPWIVFKDACNLRSPQQHCGVVHSSNLCTEITLNTSEDEIAVCNLGSVNLPRHLKNGRLDGDKIARTVRTAVRMLDNVIDINHYAVDKARRSNLRHRPIGLGIMGFQDCLYEMGISYVSDEAVEFADSSMERIAYHAYSASSDLAMERGAYETFAGSLWDRGILPLDSIQLLEDGRGGRVAVDRSSRLDWEALRARIQKQGMRNSNCLAIAPTATIANIVGVTSSIEPTYQNMYVKSNLSGDFTVSNVRLVAELKALGIWDETMVADIKYYDGLLSRIDRVPEDIRKRYLTAHEIDPRWLVKAAARRQKWIDQAQSLNLYFADPEGGRLNGKTIDEVYRSAWRHGLKTTYYLRSMGANATEKYTTQTGAHNAVPNGAAGSAAGNGSGVKPRCDDEICEVCQ